LLHQDERTISSRSDEWWTPHELFWFLVDLYHFLPMLDICATEANSLRNLFFTKKDNALKRIWMIGKKKRKCWCNPPNSKMKYFLKQAFEMWDKYRIQTMMVVPLNIQSSINYWKYVQRPMEKGERIMVRPIEGRKKFLFKGRDKGTSINGYCVVIFGRRNRFMLG